MRSGILLLDKPAGITSHDLVARTRKVLGTRKVGHAGTLDPMATGLMLLGFNAATRLLHFLVGLDKQYETQIQLGVSTTTDDFEGEIISSADYSSVAEAQVDAEIRRLTGDIEQVPSKFSAVKIAGKKAYELARAGEEVTLQPRKVSVSRFDRTSELVRSGGKLQFSATVECSSGTYVRALARDLGDSLGVGGHLLALRRTRIGKFDVSDAEVLGEKVPRAMSMTEAISKVMPTLEISNLQEIDIRHGKGVVLDFPGDQVAAVSANNHLAAIMKRAGKDFRSLAVFPQEAQ